MDNQKITEAPWRVHTSSLLNQVLDNPGTEILTRPLQIFGRLLAQVADRAAALNDPILNDLMCRLTLYSAADPASPDFNKKLLIEVSEKAEQFRVSEGKR
jgi:hypothetical protein